MNFNCLLKWLPWLGLLAFSSIATCDPLDEAKAIVRAKEAIIKERGNASQYLRLVRCEDLEDELFLCQVHVKGKTSKFAYIYEVYGSGIEIFDGNRIVMYGLGEDYPKWYVAVARQTGEVYGLYGFNKATESFNRMAMDAQIKIDDETTASFYHRLYFRCVLKNDYGMYVGYRSDLRGQIDSIFCSPLAGMSVKACENKLDKWWKGFLKSGIVPEEHVARQGDKYLITYFTLIETDNLIPLLRKVTYSISEDGLVGPVIIKPLYPESAFSRPQRMVS
jgi:hypothetical protein